jgi:hypothetical protein
MKHVIPPTTEIPVADRLPTFHELASFDAGEVWDRLLPEQPRQIGMLALQFGTVGQCEGYYHTTLQGVRKGFMSSHWTPAVQVTAVWPRFILIWSRVQHAQHLKRSANTSILYGLNSSAGCRERRGPPVLIPNVTITDQSRASAEHPARF